MGRTLHSSPHLPACLHHLENTSVNVIRSPSVSAISHRHSVSVLRMNEWLTLLHALVHQTLESEQQLLVLIGCLRQLQQGDLVPHYTEQTRVDLNFIILTELKTITQSIDESTWKLMPCDRKFQIKGQCLSAKVGIDSALRGRAFSTNLKTQYSHNKPECRSRREDRVCPCPGCSWTSQRGWGREHDAAQRECLQDIGNLIDEEMPYIPSNWFQCSDLAMTASMMRCRVEMNRPESSLIGPARGKFIIF